MKKIISLLLMFFFIGCKTSSYISEKVVTKELDILEILNAHYGNTRDFDTAYIHGNATFIENNRLQKVNIDIKIKKDEKILINIKVFGFSMAKILITPSEVKYYEKINNRFFEGDFAFLSNKIGLELDFKKIQNLLLGQAIDDLNEDKLISTIENGLHKLELLQNSNYNVAYFFEESELLLKRTVINQEYKKRVLSIYYSNYKKIGIYTIPTEIKIVAKQDKNIHLNLIYDRASFNEKLNFTYNVPKNYKSINPN